MALYYQTEYRMGKRGRVSRSYSGFQALLAIVFDLFFGLIFELLMLTIGLAFRLTVLATKFGVKVLKVGWYVGVVAMTMAVYAVTFPFALVHHAVGRLRSRNGDARLDHRAGPILKPDWALSREI